MKPEISSAVALFDRERKRILLYYVSPAELHSEEIVAYLKQYLPVYMIPSGYMRLEKLPLTANGKINRKNLPDIIQEYSEEDVSFSLSQEVSDVIDAFKKVIGTDCVNRNDNFFLIGGNSLKAVELISLLNEKFARKLNILDVFSAPVPYQLAEMLASDQTA